MSSSDNGNEDDGGKCCAKCGARRTAGTKLSRCSACLRIRYCSRECQKSDWKRHKRTECKELKLPDKAAKQNIMPIQDVIASSFRPVLMSEPKNVLCCCWCCGRLVKKCDENGKNPNQDHAGPFWTETFGRLDGATPPQRGRSFPALWILGEPGSTGYYCAVNNHQQAVACSLCACALQKDDGKHAERHIQKCEGYLYDEKYRAARRGLGIPKLNSTEKRLLAKIVVDYDPNLSEGVLSIGGYMNKEGSNKKIAVPYNYNLFEHLAFPNLLCEAKEFDGKSADELLQYTVMRLYSADKAWREDIDYVCFCALRLAAFGCASAKDIVRQLPAPVPLGSQLRNDQFRVIALVPGFH
uniref:MYND-type domain-containing protein n=1 Tax=Grammatophora oceanica TaxID=210454 RepID=A0A7S1UR03_9STRA|mmetsp:Transcript_14065/g.20590  ORF Transcript_14065/g.20590 Transcript_14065/m.20590 type:complete len:354 (+) Transcript_14065:3-1064(+)